ncbi:unnamed protein product [Arabidopsis halleri]
MRGGFWRGEVVGLSLKSDEFWSWCSDPMDLLVDCWCHRSRSGVTEWSHG